jgi:hypothetical protein
MLGGVLRTCTFDDLLLKRAMIVMEEHLGRLIFVGLCSGRLEGSENLHEV